MVPVLRPLAAAALVGVFACGGADSGRSSAPAAAPGKKVDASTAGSISGRVAIDGTVPPNTPIKMGSDPVCAAANKDGLMSENYVVDAGGLENVFVYIKDDLATKYAFDPPSGPVKIEQKGCRYMPHVVGIRAGQPLVISNDDSTMHSVHGLGRSNQEFNFSQPLPGLTNTVAMTTPEVLVPVKCDVHPWMHAFIGVVAHPYFAVTSNGGKFELRGVPPGTYTVEAIHEKLGSQTQSVTVGDKESKEIAFTFKAAAS
jgi:hypothetical protein